MNNKTSYLFILALTAAPFLAGSLGTCGDISTNVSERSQKHHFDIQNNNPHLDSNDADFFCSKQLRDQCETVTIDGSQACFWDIADQVCANNVTPNALQVFNSQPNAAERATTNVIQYFSSKAWNVDRTTREEKSIWKTLGIDVHLWHDAMTVAGAAAVQVLGMKYIRPHVHIPGRSIFSFGDFSRDAGRFSMYPAAVVNHYTEKQNKFVSSVVSAPFGEEISMRLVLQHGLLRKLPEWVLTQLGVENASVFVDNTFAKALRIVVTSALFAFAHDRQNYFSPFLGGLNYGIQMEYTQNVFASMASHSLFNFLSVIRMI